MSSITATESAVNSNGHSSTNGNAHNCFPVAFFESLNKTRATFENATLAQLRERLTSREIRPDKAGPLISFTTYRDGYTTRCNEAIEAVTALVADCDESHTLPEIVAVIERLGVAAIIYSSHRHGLIEKPEAPAPGERYRVVFPLESNVLAKDYPDVWERFNQLFDGELDPACKDLSRAYYLPSCPDGSQDVAVAKVSPGRLLKLRDLPKLPKDFHKPQWSEAGQTASGTGRPGDDYSESATNEITAAILEKHGWKVYGSQSGILRAKRPGKRDKGISATIGHHGPGKLHCFSSNAEPFEARHAYRAHQVLALLDYGGDFSAMARELGKQGYGKKQSVSPQPIISGRAPQAESTPESPPEPYYDFYSLQRMADLPRFAWLVRGWLLEKITSLISGNSGSYKSFFVLAMALCVALGREFMGRETKQGNVVYVAAEGFFTISERAQAWAIHHNCELPENFHVLKVPVNLADENVVARFAQAVAEFSPALIVLDTLSQNAAGADENSNAAMGAFIGGMMKLGNSIGAHVMVLHHNAKSTGTFRGASAIKDNIDAHISLEKPEGADDDDYTVFVRCVKQRGKPFEAFALRGQSVTLPFADEYGDPITSLVFSPCGDAVAPQGEKHPNAKKADKTGTALLEVFDQVQSEAAALGVDGVKIGFWKAKATDETDTPVCSESAFWRHRKALEKSGAIEECGSHNGSPLFRRKQSTLTTLTTANDSTDSKPINEAVGYSHNCHTPLGVTVLRVPTAIGENSSTLPEMPTPKTKKKTNAQADSEAYAASGADEGAI